MYCPYKQLALLYHVYFCIYTSQNHPVSPALRPTLLILCLENNLRYITLYGWILRALYLYISSSVIYSSRSMQNYYYY